MSQPSPKKKKKEKLTAAEKAAQRRAKILARGQNRINFLFGQTEVYKYILFINSPDVIKKNLFYISFLFIYTQDTTVVSSAADLTQEEVVIAQQVV